MNNPFDVIEARLSNIENLILDLKHKSDQAELAKQPNKLITVQGAANFLSLTVPTIYSKVSRNELPFMKKGKRLYFTKSELLDYVKQGRNTTNKEVDQAAEEYINNNRNSEK